MFKELNDIPADNSIVEKCDKKWKVKWVQVPIKGDSPSAETVTVVVPGFQEDDEVLSSPFYAEVEKELAKDALVAMPNQELQLKVGDRKYDYIGRIWYRDYTDKVYKIVLAQIQEAAVYDSNKTEWKDLPLKEVETDSHKNLVRLANVIYNVCVKPAEQREPDYLPQ
jgi:hypothetical protein